MERAAWLWLRRLAALQEAVGKECSAAGSLQLKLRAAQHDLADGHRCPCRGQQDTSRSQQLGICVRQHGLACRRKQAQKHLVSSCRHVLRGQGALAGVWRAAGGIDGRQSHKVRWASGQQCLSCCRLHSKPVSS